MAPDPNIGEELQRFFDTLLDAGKKTRYLGNPNQRKAVIEQGIPGGDAASQEARRLLQAGTLQEVEGHLEAYKSSTGSSQPTIIVWPPM